jgi:eukaryotic-like serine/threonine-protein kinase
MEHISGRTVADILRDRGRFDPASITEIGIGVAGALSALHAASFIHRDVKCSNIMLEASCPRMREAVRLIDFGIAVGESVTHTRIAGTLPYLAPEVVDGGRPGAQSDVYALGVSMFLMATGELPYRASDTRDLASSLHVSAPRRVRALRPLFPAQLDDIIQRAMAKYPAQRFESAAALSQALEAVDVGPREIESTLLRTGTASAVGAYEERQELVTP